MKLFATLCLCCVLLSAAGRKFASHSLAIGGPQRPDRRMAKSGKSKSAKSGKSKSAKSSKSSKSSKSAKAKGKSKSKSKKKSPVPKRKCKNYVEKDAVALQCSAEEGKIKDKIDFLVETTSLGAEIHIKYKHDNRTLGERTKKEEKFSIGLHSLVEYAPESEEVVTEGYDWDNSIVIQTKMLSKWNEFSDITESSGVYQFHVTTKDGTVRLTFKLSQEENEDENLSANRIKMDVDIFDFKWQQEDTLLALLSTVEAKTKIKSHTHPTKADNGKGKKFYPSDVIISFDAEGANLPYGELFWVQTAEVDENTITSEVVATSPIVDDDSNATVKSQAIAYAFLNSSKAERIYWDPETGVGYSKNDDSNSGMNDNNSSGALSFSGLAVFRNLLSVAGGALLVVSSW